MSLQIVVESKDNRGTCVLTGELNPMVDSDSIQTESAKVFKEFSDIFSVALSGNTEKQILAMLEDLGLQLKKIVTLRASK